MMLLSKVIRLEKAEKHIHVFHDPECNPELDKSYMIANKSPLSLHGSDAQLCPSSKLFIWTAIAHSTTQLRSKGSEET